MESDCDPLGLSAEKARFDPVLKTQIETSLHGAYSFNAQTAKHGVVWVILIKTLTAVAGLIAFSSLLLCSVLVATGDPLEVTSYWSVQPYNWSEALIVAVGAMVAAGFLGHIGKAVSISHATSVSLASEYYKSANRQD